nr:biotin-dependent carboxyltransferase family protein [Kineosphaera limosa]
MEVIKTGPQVVLEDLGRPGLASIGVSRSGAADFASYLLGGRLVGHSFDRELGHGLAGGFAEGGPGPAALEVLLGGLVARAHGDLTIALTGAPTGPTIDGRRIDEDAPVRMHDGEVLSLGVPEQGLRTYVSVRGGFDVEPVLGSRSRDTLSGIGPVVEPGTFLPVGQTNSEPQPFVDHVTLAPPTGDLVDLEVLPGPRGDWLDDLGKLASTYWTASLRSNRVGLRLTGPALKRRPDRVGVELPSEGAVRGTIQVPHGGEPVIFLADHPVTGGYPAVGVLTRDSVNRAAQIRPGQEVKLRFVTKDTTGGTVSP